MRSHHTAAALGVLIALLAVIGAAPSPASARPNQGATASFEGRTINLADGWGDAVAWSYNQNLWIGDPFEGATYLPRLTNERRRR